MNEKANKYALAALKDKRASLASEIVQIERQLRHRKDMLVHVDAALKLLDPSIQTETIPNKRAPQRIKLFRQGELGRLIVNAMREAGRPVSTAEIVTAILEAGLEAGGHGEEARQALRGRVRGNLAYLERRGKVVKSGNGRAVRWSLV